MEQSELEHETAEAPVLEMTPLHPNQIKVLRVRSAVTALALLAAALAIDAGPLRGSGVPPLVVPAVIALLGLGAVLILPRRRYRAWGYAEGEDELQVRHGLLVRVRTLVPFGRVQHIDVTHGPVERRYGVARLVLHTAGTRSAEISLPGLAQDEAERMRDRIRSKIRQDLL